MFRGVGMSVQRIVCQSRALKAGFARNPCPVPPLRFGEGARGRGPGRAAPPEDLSPPAPLSETERGEKSWRAARK